MAGLGPARVKKLQSGKRQVTLLPECLDDFITEDDPVCVVEVFIDEQDLRI